MSILCGPFLSTDLVFYFHMFVYVFTITGKTVDLKFKLLQGIIVNTCQKKLFFMKSFHWFALRNFDGIWYNLDSKLQAPVLVNYVRCYMFTYPFLPGIHLALPFLFIGFVHFRHFVNQSSPFVFASRLDRSFRASLTSLMTSI